MALKDRVAVIDEELFERLKKLYGQIDIADLDRIVNKHIRVAVEEIEEDVANIRNFKEFDSKYPDRSEMDFEEC